MNLTEEQLQKLKNISSRIVKMYESSETIELKSSCLNLIRQSLEYLCLFTCEVYGIKITRTTKKGDQVENDNPTLGDMAPLIEKHFKENNVLWSKEIGMHIGSIWIVGNLGSHAQKDMLNTDSDISKETVENALNSMTIVTEWFYNHYGLECPVKRKSAKVVSEFEREVQNRINRLFERLALLKQKRLALGEDAPIQTAEENFPDIYFDDLVEAIELGQCILFLGPNLSVDEKGNSLHEVFFKSISRRNIEYNETDAFFMPKSEKQIELKALNYYNKKFHEENSIAQRLLEKLAQIPFSLIISVTPDDTMHYIFEKYNKKHEFVYYNARTKQKVNEPSIENPVIFNMLGNTAADGKYIFTHKQFYDYVNQKQEVKIPFEIETKIKDVAHYLFVGIDFNKWYNRLLLFTLNLYEEAEAYGFTTDTLDDMHKDYVKQQFNISFVEGEYENFVDVLLQKCKQQNLTKDLINEFIANTTQQITQISNLSEKEAVLEQLSRIENKISEIETLI